MDDLISRQAAMNLFKDDDYVVNELNNLAPAQPEWIPCSERLPEYGVEVLTCDRDGDFCINHIIDDLLGEWFDDNNGPVAWCELPEPYAEEKL